MSTLRHKIALFVLAATLSAVAGSLHNPPMFCDARTGQCSECVNDGVENGCVLVSMSNVQPKSEHFSVFLLVK